ncbi:LysR substrate-binding domain-containing protein [Roseivivax marinus]|jgi:DNA-binding transcriptional LysR family regulator|uniref:LysR substrate-binding domain-containing protein n=1 Tax=Roseivivax marinus TaxID=1379903 RepID=UPI001F046024|nr:LysR substrate-binding domain-containing protein [Roseivivax marinus]UMA66382.1 LysR substrate-binding domain-containing protein [Roseivivax marinus]
MSNPQQNARARRLIPPLGALRALEALDRLGSATAVARELDLSQSAVSRQIRTLEDGLEVSLVQREGRNLVLTDAARDYARTVRGALDRIAQASLALRLPARAGSLDLAMLPSFGMRWLVPRLADFARRHPDITINLATRIRPCDFATDPFDAALEFGGPPRPGTQRLKLRPERTLPVCAPDLVPDGPLPPEDLHHLPLLQMETRPDAWRDWFAAHGVTVASSGTGTTFDQFTAMREGAQAGLGVALLPDHLTETELATGTLVRATTAEPVSLGAYWLVWPTDRADGPAINRFRDWISTQAEAEDDPLPR